MILQPGGMQPILRPSQQVPHGAAALTALPIQPQVNSYFQKSLKIENPDHLWFFKCLFSFFFNFLLIFYVNFPNFLWISAYFHGGSDPPDPPTFFQGGQEAEMRGRIVF